MDNCKRWLLVRPMIDTQGTCSTAFKKSYSISIITKKIIFSVLNKNKYYSTLLTLEIR